ncbi:hypothetical protein [Crocinitomix catalasitica]|uniref:hypothetical protein n=1 Tax=Crocinitomix catalasitica TaxID=184607 RepID=UPI000481A67E|nr:hypothetical protein [Crocinitomix catalasitica]
MKTIIIGLIASTFILASCKKNEPAYVIEGEYSGSIDATYMDHDTIANSGYAVRLTAINDNKVKVEGNDFKTFEVLVTTNGINVEAVNKSDTIVTNFLYIGKDNKLNFTYSDDDNLAKYIGVK